MLHSHHTCIANLHNSNQPDDIQGQSNMGTAQSFFSHACVFAFEYCAAFKSRSPPSSFQTSSSKRSSRLLFLRYSHLQSLQSLLTPLLALMELSTMGSCWPHLLRTATSVNSQLPSQNISHTGAVGWKRGYQRKRHGCSEFCAECIVLQQSV